MSIRNSAAAYLNATDPARRRVATARSREIAKKLLKFVELDEGHQIQSAEELLRALKRAKEYFGSLSREDCDRIFKVGIDPNSFTKPQLLTIIDRMIADAEKITEYDKDLHSMRHLLETHTGVKLSLFSRIFS